MDLHKQLYQLRKLSGMTQEQLGNKIGVSRQTISKWEQGSSVPDWESMIKISEIFGLSLNDFVPSSDKNTTDHPASDRITLKDLIELEKFNKKRQRILVLSAIFFTISILTLVYVYVIRESILSIQYTLYRYIVLEQYSYAQPDYFFPCFISGILIIIGCILMIIYFRMKNSYK